MDVRKLRYFVEVADRLHFTEAARALGVSQQPLSRAIRELETELDTRLLERTTRRVALTQSGEVLREHAVRILRDITLAERATRANGRAALRMAYPGTYEGFPINAAAQFSEAHPELTLDCIRTPSSKQVHAVRSGDVDVGFVVPPVAQPGLSSAPLIRVPMRIATLAASPAIHDLEGLRGRRWIAYDQRRKGPLQAYVRDTFSRLGLEGARAGTARDEADAVSMVEHGVGIAIVSAAAATPPTVRTNGLPFLPPIELRVIWRCDERQSDVAALIDHLTAWAEDAAYLQA